MMQHLADKTQYYTWRVSVRLTDKQHLFSFKSNPIFFPVNLFDFYYLFNWFLRHETSIWCIMFNFFPLNHTDVDISVFKEKVEHIFNMIFVPEMTGNESTGNFIYFRHFSVTNQLIVVVFVVTAVEEGNIAVRWFTRINFSIECFKCGYKISWFLSCIRIDAIDLVMCLHS